jgi:preprotein translocase subunit YajC
MNQFILFLQAAPPQAGMGISGTLMFLGIALVVMYFFMIRPQGKIRQQQTDFMSSLKRGTKIVTIGGIFGTIMEINDKEVQLLIAPKMIITIRRDAISMDFTKALNSSTDAATPTTAPAALSGTTETATSEK